MFGSFVIIIFRLRTKTAALLEQKLARQTFFAGGIKDWLMTNW